MPMNKIPKLREPGGPIVQQVRDLFLEREYKEKPEDFYIEDVRLIENMDFLLQRSVIMQRKNVEASVKSVSEVLRWRKEKKLYDMSELQFPQELSLCGAAFLYENDKFGNRTLYLRAKMCKNCLELKDAMKDYLTYLLFKIDDPKVGSTFSVIMDLTDTSWTNYDIDLLMHLLALLKDYFPVNLDYVLAVNFPWLFSAAWSLVKRLIPAEKRDVVQFINSDKIFDFISKENCPDFLGGKCTRRYEFVNEKSPTSLEYLLTNESMKPPTKKRLKEILTLFKDALPKDHIEKLKNQLESVQDGVKYEITRSDVTIIDNNNNIDNNFEMPNKNKA